MLEGLQEMGLSPEAQALAEGMLLGDKSALSHEMVQDFRVAGMSHILAVSGLHVGIIMSVLWMLFSPVEWLTLLIAPLRMRTYYVLGNAKRVLTILVTSMYVWYIGAPPSAVRATVMLGMCLLGWMLHRPTSAWRCMIFAALVLLAWNPWSIITPGFQLSFLAVTGILLFQPWLQNEELPRCFRLLLFSVAAQWLTAPVVAYWFHQVPLLGFIQGLLVVPLMPLFVMLLLVGLALPGCNMIVILIELLTQWMRWVASSIGQLERLLLGGHLYFYPSWWEVLVAEVLLLAIVVYLRLSRRGPTIEERKEKLRKQLKKKRNENS